MNSEAEIKKKVIETLKTVYDPEIPINIYDLGLVYSIEVKNDTIEVELGVTSPLCPIAYLIAQQAEYALRKTFPDKKVDVRLNLERIWDPSRMTEEGRMLFKQLFGYDPVERYPL